MSLQEKIIGKLLESPTAKKAFEQKVNSAILEEKKKLAEEATQVIKKIKTEEIQKRNYVITSPQSKQSSAAKSFDAKELPSGKIFETLHRLYSDSPGSIQCSDRIIDSVIGNGFVIEAVNGKKGKKSDKQMLIDFFDNPNAEGETIEDIISGGISNLHSYGNWYMEKVLNKRGTKISEIYNLDSSRMSVLVDDEKHKGGVDVRMGYMRRTDFGKKIVYSPEQVMHIKRFSKRAGVYGEAIFESNTSVLLLILNALTYNINIMNNGGIPSIQINLPEDSTENDAQLVSQFFEANFGGVYNAGKPLVTYKGAKASVLGITPSDISYMELLEFGVTQVAGMYGVPPILIGIPDGTNRASASSSIKAYYMNKIEPLRRYISRKITKEIIVDGFGITDWKFDFRGNGLEESDATRRDVMTGYSRGLYNFNETRVKLGLLPINEGWADKYYLIGSKNDRLVPIEVAIELGSKEPDADDGTDTTPDNPDAPEMDDNRTQGEGADENDN